MGHKNVITFHQKHNGTVNLMRQRLDQGSNEFGLIRECLALAKYTSWILPKIQADV